MGLEAIIKACMPILTALAAVYLHGYAVASITVDQLLPHIEEDKRFPWSEDKGQWSELEGRVTHAFSSIFGDKPIGG